MGSVEMAEIDNKDEISQEQRKKHRGLDNLKPFPPGVSGNPGGRPPGVKDFSTVFKEALYKLAKAEGKDDEAIYLEIIENGVRQAKAGEFKYFQYILDRLYGKAKETVENTIIPPISIVSEAVAAKREEEK